jgi:hypothetical protein
MHTRAHREQRCSALPPPRCAQVVVIGHSKVPLRACCLRRPHTSHRSAAHGGSSASVRQFQQCFTRANRRNNSGRAEKTVDEMRSAARPARRCVATPRPRPFAPPAPPLPSPPPPISTRPRPSPARCSAPQRADGCATARSWEELEEEANEVEAMLTKKKASNAKEWVRLTADTDSLQSASHWADTCLACAGNGRNATQHSMPQRSTTRRPQRVIDRLATERTAAGHCTALRERCADSRYSQYRRCRRC